MKELQDIPSERIRFQHRLREEIARSTRFDRSFVLAVFEATQSSMGLPMHERMEKGLKVVRASLRAYDILAPVFEDTLAALMPDTTAVGATAALTRVRTRLATHAGSWTIVIYAYPLHAADIDNLPLVRAA